MTERVPHLGPAAPPDLQAVAPESPDPIDLSEAFRGREILLTGVTGFLGKVALVMLLDRYPEIGRVHVLVRPRAGGSAEDRFFGKVASAPPFRPLQEKHGEGLGRFLREKCTPIAGDVAEPLLGLSEEQVRKFTGKLACVVNCAGLVTFNPSLELAISVNTEGARNAAELCKRTGATLVHVSTCFVAGTRRGPVFEDEMLVGSFPKQHAEGEGEDLPGARFSVDAEQADVDRLVKRLREQADDHSLQAQFRAAAVRRLESEGRDISDERALRLAAGRERKLWLSQKLIDAGMERAQVWGWPNTYTYTKAMGEQAIAMSGCAYSIVRPAIVESALRFPFPGWNEGFTTSAPLVFLALKGQRVYPAGQKLVLDLIPVDLVAAGILGVAGAACAGRAERVYQLASGDMNPMYIRRAIELSAIYKRRYFEKRREGGGLRAFLDEWLEPFPVEGEAYRKTSAPLFRKLAQAGRALIAEKGASWGAPITSALLKRADQALENADRQLASVEAMWDLYLPFVAGERFVFQCAHTRELWRRLTPSDREKLPWDPEKIDWRRYWLDVHVQGLEEWVFPGLEEESDKARREVPQPKDLLQLLNASVHHFGKRVALRFFAGEALTAPPAGSSTRGSGAATGCCCSPRTGRSGRWPTSESSRRARRRRRSTRNCRWPRSRTAPRRRARGCSSPLRARSRGSARRLRGCASSPCPSCSAERRSTGSRCAGPPRQTTWLPFSSPAGPPASRRACCSPTATSPRSPRSSRPCSICASGTGCSACCRCTTPSSSPAASWCRCSSAPRSPTWTS